MGRGGRRGGRRLLCGGGGRSSARSSGGRSNGASRGGYSGGADRGGYSAGGSRGRASAFVAMAFFIIVFVALAMFSIFSSAQGGANVASRAGASVAKEITKSTVKREKLEPQYVTTMGWYTDELGWIKSGTKLTTGMLAFYNETGVQPYLYITDTANGTASPSDADMEACARQLYEELFSDDVHILLLFYEHGENRNYKTQYACGSMAKTVMDQEACGILLDYVDYYYSSNLEGDEMFSLAFEKAGERIMSVTRSPVLYVIIALVVLAIVFAAFAWRRRAMQQRNIEAEQKERILKADIGSVEDPALKELEEKYKE